MGRRRKSAERKYRNTEEGPRLLEMKAKASRRGLVRLDMTGEDDDTLFAEVEWPPRSGRHWLCCATTGLLFDIESGRCAQSDRVWVKMETLGPWSGGQRAYKKWFSARKGENVYGRTPDYVLD